MNAEGRNTVPRAEALMEGLDVRDLESLAKSREARLCDCRRKEDLTGVHTSVLE